MVCCDCDDDCQDKMKCACWQLSIQHTDAAPGMKGKIIKYKTTHLNLQRKRFLIWSRYYFPCYILLGRTDSEVGYVYRRLVDNVPTGIFECNIGCKCKSTCLNRVAQVSFSKILNNNYLLLLCVS